MFASPRAQWKDGCVFLGSPCPLLFEGFFSLFLEAFTLVTFAKHHLMAEVFWLPSDLCSTVMEAVL